MTDLSTVESSLALFAEGIAGQYLHIKAVTEFEGRSFELAKQKSAQGQGTLYLPETLPGQATSAYRVLAVQQISRRQFGTFTFRIDTARVRLGNFGDATQTPQVPRQGDFELFFYAFKQPSLMAVLFELIEQARLDAQAMHAYPGMRRHFERYYRQLAQTPLQSKRLKIDSLLSEALTDMQNLTRDVYDTAAWCIRCYQTLAIDLTSSPMDQTLLQDIADPTTSWLQRESRLDDWQEDLADLDQELSGLQFIDDDAEVGNSEGLDGEIREQTLQIRALQDQRDQLERRVDMERSALRHALGEDRPQARSYRYDEWDYLQQIYRYKYCRLYEQRLPHETGKGADALRGVIKQWQPAVKDRLARIRPLGYLRQKHIEDGDELDLDALIEARLDTRAGISPDERYYSRKEKTQRDLGVIFLVDLSASTDDPVDKPEPPVWDEDDEWAPNPVEPVEEEPARRIIDILREAMLVMTAALEQLGDDYGIYGFSGYGKDCVEVFIAKELGEGFSPAILNSIAAMQPKRSTRMGPAVRHSTMKLLRTGCALKLLIVVSDGFPQDCDYGPERGDHEYGLQDTARALIEAQQKGIETFCVTVDRSGHDYLKRMCPRARYMVIDELADLPLALTKVYQTLAH